MQRPGQRPNGEDRAEDAVLPGALVVDLGGHQRRGHLEVEAERARDEQDRHHEHDVGPRTDVGDAFAQLTLGAR